MTVELGLVFALVLVAVFSGALGFSGARSRTASFARALFYAVLLATMVVLVVGILGVTQMI